MKTNENDLRSNGNPANPTTETSLSFFPQHKTKAISLVDPDADTTFASGIRHYLSSAKKAPLPDDVEKTVDCIHTESYAISLQRLTTGREEELRLSNECCEEANRLEGKLLHGKIPEFCNEQSWMLPHGVGAKIAFAILLLVGILAPPAEVINFAWYIRFQTQSFLTAFLYCSSILTIPVAEVAILRRLVRDDKTKKHILLIQAVFACASATVYILLTLRHGDISLASMFSGETASVSTDTVRMAAQIVTSILLSAICLHSAIEMGRREAPENDAFREGTERVKKLRKDAGEHFDTVSEINGALETIQVQKPKAILFCNRQFARIEAEFDRHNSTLHELFNEPISTL